MGRCTKLKDFITKKGIYVAIAAVIIAIIAAVSVALSGGNADFGTILSEPFFSPLKSVMTSLVGSLEEVYGYMYRYDEISAENKELKARIAALEEDYREYTEISQENDRLRALLDFNSRHSGDNFEYEPVSIISWTASNFASSFTINQGSSSGIELYDSVVTENGYLVGQVTEVGVSTSTVVSILDTTMNIGAVLYESDEPGIIEGDFALFKEGKLKLGYLSEDANVITGDAVVSSGRGGAFPSGLIIGYVEGLAENTSGHDFYAVVRPAADFNDIWNLYVITDYATD